VFDPLQRFKGNDFADTLLHYRSNRKLSRGLSTGYRQEGICIMLSKGVSHLIGLPQTLAAVTI
jgi:hypothetical protein